jgi:hypothetical protein
MPFGPAGSLQVSVGIINIEGGVKGKIKGKLADIMIINANPLKNLQVLYGTGAIELMRNNKVVRTGGVLYTIKDGIIYDAKKLLSDVKQMVDEEKRKTGWQLKQPGM